MSKTKVQIVTILLLIILSLFELLTSKEQVIQNTGQNSQETSQSTTSNTRQKTKVTKVIDGDTIEIEGGFKVRYIGIDTPEISGKVEYFGKEAASKNRELVENKEIELEKDVSETDKYGRLLRYVFVNGEMINERLVRDGFAKVSTFPPDVKFKDLFLEAQEFARNNKVGLWR
jgi:micrococcal nuclease